MKIFLSNLSFAAGAAELDALFSVYGTVTSIKLIEDQHGRPRGIGFIEMSSFKEAEKAIAALNGKQLKNRCLSISVAREKPTPYSFREKDNRSRKNNTLFNHADMG